MKPSLGKGTSDSPLLLYGHVLLFGNHLPRLPMNHLSHSLLMFVNSGISTYTEISLLVTEKNKKMNPSLNREIGKGLKNSIISEPPRIFLNKFSLF